MKFLKKKNKLRDVAALTTATASLASLALASSPVLALTFGFCGSFTDGSGSVLPSQIRVDDNGNFDGFAQIATDVNGEIRNYTASDFVERTEADTSNGIPSFKYTFSFSNNGLPDILDNFMAFLPRSIFPTQPGQLPDLTLFQPINMMEVRDGIVRVEPDRLVVVPVPEPTSILGTAIAIGLGGMLTKKNLSKLKDDKEAA